MIRRYRKKLYDDWYSSLTDEQKQRLEEYRKEQAEQRRHEAEMALARLGMMFAAVNEATHGGLEDCMEKARLVNKISLHPSKYW